ncbi:ABC transporter substrate-binding protein [Desulfoplanes formicivorans]|nr:ABC transporter substrate binding protein [Desulfoplanes formicivorans]
MPCFVSRFLQVFVISVSIVGVVAYSAVSWAGKNDKVFRVFVVHSYGPDHICGAPQFRGIERALTERLGKGRLVFEHFYMLTKTQYITPDEIRQRGDLALRAIKDFDPDLIMTLDDNAFRTVGLDLAGDATRPVVFSGLNNPPEVYNQTHRFMQSRSYPGGNITGIYEKLYLYKTLQVLKQALPQCRRVVGITDESFTGQALYRQMLLEAEQNRGSLPVEWELRQVRTFREYKQLVDALNRDTSVDAIFPLAFLLVDEQGRPVSGRAILSWTLVHSSLPELAINYELCRLGLFGGAAVHFESMGYAAGLFGVAILEGQHPGNLPIVDAPEFAIVFNTSRAAMLSKKIPLPLLMAADAVYTSMPLIEQQ